MEAPLTGAEPKTFEHELVAESLPVVAKAARVRAAAVYYGFAMLSVGFLIVLLALLCVGAGLGVGWGKGGRTWRGAPAMRVGGLTKRGRRAGGRRWRPGWGLYEPKRLVSYRGGQRGCPGTEHHAALGRVSAACRAAGAPSAADRQLPPAPPPDTLGGGTPVCTAVPGSHPLPCRRVCRQAAPASHHPSLPAHPLPPPRSRESLAWRNTLTAESAAWREFVKAEIHAMGLA